MLRKLLKKLKLKYDDPLEEQEFFEVRFPFVTKFLEVIYISMKNFYFYLFMEL